MGNTDFNALIRDPERAGPCAASRDAGAIEKAARAAGFAVHQVDLARVAARGSLFATLARGLALPDYFGANWDALEECLGDPAWMTAPGCCIVLANCGPYAEAQPDEFSTLIDVCDSVAGVWRSDGKPFWVLFGGVPGSAFGLAGPGER